VEYDDFGRETSVRYYSAMDMPADNREGFAAHYTTYTDSGLVAEESYENSFGEPVAIDGFSSRELVSEHVEDGTYVMRELNESAEEETEHTAKLQTYDHYDRPIVTRYFDFEDKPIEGPEGSAMVTREYTSRNKVSMIRYYDGEGNGAQVNGVDGLSKEYNSYDNLDLETWLDGNGQPAMNDDGYASIKYDYDLSNSNTVERYYQVYLDAEGNPVEAKNGAWGQTMLYYPATRVHKATFIDQNEEPVVTSEGYAVLEYEEDENGNRVWEGYYDEVGAQINCNAGYSSVEREYDGEGRLISERYLDRYNKLTNNVDGVAGWNGYYDAEGNLIVNSRYDQDRNQLPTDEQ